MNPEEHEELDKVMDDFHRTFVDDEAKPKKLPKASIIKILWWPSSMWTTFRGANFWQLHLGHLVVILRAPWLKRPTRQLHPELFT